MADIEIEAERPEETVPSFEVMGLDLRLLRALTKRGLSDPTAVQAKCIPLAMVGSLSNEGTTCERGYLTVFSNIN